MSIDWDRMYHGICPQCGEDKFIGHGPLCVDCYLNPDTPSALAATEDQ